MSERWAKAGLRTHESETTRVRVSGDLRAWTSEELEAFFQKAFPASWLAYARVREIDLVKTKIRERGLELNVVAKSREETPGGDRILSVNASEDPSMHVSPEQLYSIMIREVIAELSCRPARTKEAETYLHWGDRVARAHPEGIGFVGRRASGDERETSKELEERANQLRILFGLCVVRAFQAIEKVGGETRADEKRAYVIHSLIAQGFHSMEIEEGIRALEQALGDLSLGAQQANQEIVALRRIETDRDMARVLASFPSEWKLLTEHALEALQHEHASFAVSAEEVRMRLKAEPIITESLWRVCERWIDLVARMNDLRDRGGEWYGIRSILHEFESALSSVQDTEQAIRIAERLFDALRPPRVAYED